MTYKRCNCNTVCGKDWPIQSDEAKWLYYLNDAGGIVFVEYHGQKAKKGQAYCCDRCRQEIIRREINARERKKTDDR